MKLIIDRSKWFRGQGPVASRLVLPEDGRMCCLGFFGLALGVPAEGMRNVANPVTIASPAWPTWLLSNYGDCLRALLSANDSQRMTAAERELTIASVFAANGVEVEFIDGEPS